ncbi:hypothetical protein ABH917_001023 [Thermobifida halotolerans]
MEFTDSSRVWSAPLVLRYKSGPCHDLHRLTPGQAIGAIFHAEGDPHMLTALTRSEVSAYSYEFLNEDGRFPWRQQEGVSPERWRYTPAPRHCATRAAEGCCWTTFRVPRGPGSW